MTVLVLRRRDMERALGCPLEALLLRRHLAKVPLGVDLDEHTGTERNVQWSMFGGVPVCLGACGACGERGCAP